MIRTEVILQIHCGRLFQANMLNHKGKVFEEMCKLPWQLIVPGVYQWVYLLGVFDYRGELVVTEENGAPIPVYFPRIPSLFAISNHEQTHPDLGDIEDLKKLIAIIKEAGGKVMVDYVANHTGLSHPWMKESPDLYKQHDGQFETQFSQDVAALNYLNKNLWPKMIKVLETIMSWGADGVRCDMAHLIPTDFWSDAIKHCRQKQNKFYFLAEGYSDSVFNWQPLTDLMTAGFNSVYDEFFYRNLKQVLLKNKPWSFVGEHLNYLGQENLNFLTHYLCNHDDPPVRKSANFVQSLMVLLLSMGGNILIPQGFLNGAQTRLRHHSLEVLKEKYSVIEAIPTWFEEIAKINLALQPQAKTVILEQDKISCIPLTTATGPGEWLLNMTDRTQNIDKDQLARKVSFNRIETKQLKPGAWQLLLKN